MPLNFRVAAPYRFFEGAEVFVILLRVCKSIDEIKPDESVLKIWMGHNERACC